MASRAEKLANIKQRQQRWMRERACSQEVDHVRQEVADNAATPSAVGGRAQSSAAASSITMSSSSTVGAGGQEQMLNRITERIAERLRGELRGEIEREAKLEHRVKARVAQELEGHLAHELKQHTCPICYELMCPPARTPTLLFPCGHTFCADCVEKHRAKNRDVCPYCRGAIASQAINHSLKDLIASFNAKKQQFDSDADAQIRAIHGDAPGRRNRPSSDNGGGGGGGGNTEQQKQKYLRDYHSLRMRLRILVNESDELGARRRTLSDSARASQLAHAALREEETKAREKLERARRELELVQKHVGDLEAKRARVEREQKALAEQRALVAGTIDALRRDVDKTALLVQNFDPTWRPEPNDEGKHGD